ncbi:hypothetical protein [Streptomyces adelaidensis]|uniref:hypothetical protein n=1 Tax=Streptomyces adelaidensis TaxID=2796465 RepID=UPI001904F028|nr:hypothetical protein [Streptomyces adelaidensis]
MRGLRQLTAMVGALLTALALLLLGAPPSAAGGPTSVLLASPTDQRTASLYGTQEEYGRLEQLLAAGSELGRSREEPPEWGEEEIWEKVTDMVNVTWMVHDVTPWRVDRVYAGVPDSGDIWIHTTLDVGEDTAASDSGVWHRAKQPEWLRNLLTGLGVMGQAPGSPARGELPSAGSSAEARADTGGTTTDDSAANTSDPTGLTDRARWAIPALGLGLLLGSGATLLLRRAAARRESGPPGEPRQALIDA